MRNGRSVVPIACTLGWPPRALRRDRKQKNILYEFLHSWQSGKHCPETRSPTEDPMLEGWR